MAYKTNTANENKLKQAENIINVARADSEINSADFEKFLEYRSNLLARERLYRNFTDEDGTFNIWTKGTDRDKQELNSLSYKIIDFESWLIESPYQEYLKDNYQLELPDFLSDILADENEPTVKQKTGWYQDDRGQLYFYDGVIWDEVPAMKVDSLEYLGGK